MRFIVELYRLLIIAILAIAIISASFIVFKVAQTPDLASGTTAYVTIAVFAVAMFVILSVGITATFISIHDRLESIALTAADIAESAATIASHRIDRADVHAATDLTDSAPINRE
jgi:hypothetical protein